MEKGARIEIKITSKDDGNVTKLVKDYNFYPDLGWECEFIGEFSSVLNKFMSLLGYCYNKDRVFLESVSDDEYDYLIGKLDEYRSKENKNE